MSVRASVFESIFRVQGITWPWALLLVPFLPLVVVWNRFYRRISVPDLSDDWLERHKREAPKRGQ